MRSYHQEEQRKCYNVQCTWESVLAPTGAKHEPLFQNTRKMSGGWLDKIQLSNWIDNN